MSWLSDTLGTSRPGAPTLPQSPVLQSPQLPQYPGFSPQQQSLLGQQQGYLNQAQGAVGAYGSNPYLQQSMGANQQALTNYQNALTGNIPQNQMLEQQKAQAWQQMVQNAGNQGIRITGNNPSGAISQSTAGNQAISDFNKTWGALEQNYNLGQQQFGLQSQQAGLGQVNQQFQNQLGGQQALAGMNYALQQPYQQQTLGQYQQQTQQALSNTDISNQNAMNAYQQQLQQLGLNYNNSLAGYQNSMGMLSGGLQLAGMGAGAALGGPMGAMIGGQAGGALGQTVTGQGGGGQMGFNPGSYISAYQNLQKSPYQMGFQPYQSNGTPGPYAYGS